ncbi:hypothetical protein L596_014924 [Steinernema carpocapsae]|uniref:Phosphatidylserine synthase n=1 Tax=Steinernema carpocapsae TaxID=34508 RepID=A0A4U5NDD8_STECR|nr:hypothetical protein L596_014924 [Steinernema carpocapsae]
MTSASEFNDTEDDFELENEQEILDAEAANPNFRTEEEENTQEARRFRPRRRTTTEIERIHYRFVNERVVNDITLEVLYKPHTLTVLAVLCAFLLYTAFSSDATVTSDNIYSGLKAAGSLFLVISALAFPNGPFIRPHPILWRIIFGVSVLYVLLLQFTLFQSFADVKAVLKWLDPERLNKAVLEEKEYAVNCSDVSFERVWGHMDIFAVGHFMGWTMKSMLIRHSIICWYISIAWEITEVVFTHVLPNFEECWWDAIFLDVILCNGLGIIAGLQICKFLEMRQFRWESIKNIKTTRGKFKRAVLQFTPESFTSHDWFNNYAIRRALAIYCFVMIWLYSELNTFFLKHIFAIDTAHPFVFWRIILIGLISAPSIRQFYIYATDPKIKRLGMQCWVYCAVCALEAANCVKFGRDQLPSLQVTLITAWIFILAVGTLLCVWMSVWWVRQFEEVKEVSVGGATHECYLDSSHENLGAISEDVRKRRRRLQMSDSDYY